MSGLGYELDDDARELKLGGAVVIEANGLGDDFVVARLLELVVLESALYLDLDVPDAVDALEAGGAGKPKERGGTRRLAVDDLQDVRPVIMQHGCELLREFVIASTRLLLLHGDLLVLSRWHLLLQV